jgi:branched-chain amino acid aminotransferase
LPEPVNTGVSTWQRATDVTLPYRIKTSTNYQVARLAKIEGRDRGYGEMILLNQHGRVAETIGSAIAIVRDGQVITPPSWEGAFESITIDIIEALCATMGIPFARRPIDRTELIIADEMASVSTLNDVTLISSLDGHSFGEAQIFKALGARYLRALTGEEPHPSVDLSCRAPPSVRSPSPV